MGPFKGKKIYQSLKGAMVISISSKFISLKCEIFFTAFILNLKITLNKYAKKARKGRGKHQIN